MSDSQINKINLSFEFLSPSQPASHSGTFVRHLSPSPLCCAHSTQMKRKLSCSLTANVVVHPRTAINVYREGQVVSAMDVTTTNSHALYTSALPLFLLAICSCSCCSCCVCVCFVGLVGSPTQPNRIGKSTLKLELGAAGGKASFEPRRPK